MPHPDGEIIKYACLRVCVCVRIHAQVSETSSARYLGLSLKAITSFPLLAKTTGAGWAPPSSLTNLSARRAGREQERERGKIPQRFHLSGDLSASGFARRHTYPKFPNLRNKRDWHFRWHKNVFGTNLSSWFNPRSTSVFCVNSQVSCQNLMDQLCSSSSKLKPGAYIWYSTVRYCTIRYVYDIQSLTVHYSMIRCKVMWYKIRYS